MNSFLMHASASEASMRPLSQDERRANWAFKFFGLGLHRQPIKPRIRVVTVPAPLKDSK